MDTFPNVPNSLMRDFSVIDYKGFPWEYNYEVTLGLGSVEETKEGIPLIELLYIDYQFLIKFLADARRRFSQIFADFLYSYLLADHTALIRAEIYANLREKYLIQLKHFISYLNYKKLQIITH